MTFKKWWVTQVSPIGYVGHIFSRLGLLDDVYDVAKKAYKEGQRSTLTRIKKEREAFQKKFPGVSM